MIYFLTQVEIRAIEEERRKQNKAFVEAQVFVLVCTDLLLAVCTQGCSWYFKFKRSKFICIIK